MLIKILISGDGGQGIQTIADIVCKAVFENSKHVAYVPNYGLEQRGGASLAFIQISNRKIAYPKFSKPDILVVMSKQARERTKNYKLRGVRILDVASYKEELAQNNIPASSFNIFFLGVLSKILLKRKILDIRDLESALALKLGKKSGWEANRRAFQTGMATS